MELRAADGMALRFHAYIEHLSETVGHADRHAPLRECCTGLLLPREEERRANGRAYGAGRARCEALRHFVAKALWDERELLAAVRTFALPIIERSAPIRA